MNDRIPSKGLEWTNLILGASLFCASTLFAELTVAAWNAVLVGGSIAFCSAVALRRYRPWAEWANLWLACWAIASPFLLGFGSAQPAMPIHAVIGLFVLTIAGMQLAAGRTGPIDAARE